MSALTVRSRKDVPESRHWVILTFSSISIPGDERSRTNPGHGYPASNEPIVVYTAYTDKGEWEAEVKKLAVTHEPYYAGEINPAKITVETTVTISP